MTKQSAPQVRHLASLAERCRRSVRISQRTRTSTTETVPCDDDSVAEAVRVYGPYPAPTGFRLVVLEGKLRKSVIVETLEAAEQMKRDLTMALKDRDCTVGSLLPLYRAHLVERGVVTATTLCRSVERFLGADRLMRIPPAKAAAIYEAETKRCSRGTNIVVSASAHQTLLKRTKLFYRWAVEHGHIAANPFERVKPTGRVKTGKKQFQIDEARRFTAHALRRAELGSPGAVAALTALLLGLRASEVLLRKVRDLDDNGHILWIPFGKTKNARRRLRVPDELRPHLIRLCEGKSSEDTIFSVPTQSARSDSWLWHQVRILCAEASVPRVCPHSLRGLHSTLAIEAGATSTAVAAALGHSSFAITAKHYAAPGTIESANASRVSASLLSPSQVDPSDITTAIADRLHQLGLTPEQAEQIRALFVISRSQSSDGSSR